MFQSLLASVESAREKYDEEKDVDLVTEDPGYKQEASDMHFKAGQSKRVWGELYKVFHQYQTFSEYKRHFMPWSFDEPILLIVL